MGFKIIESSGNFNPADYGLSIGDVLQIIVVGGGAGGCVNYNGTAALGTAGGATSFGSYLTALGGTSTLVGGIGGASGGAPNRGGGGGAGGFYPGFPMCSGSPGLTGTTVYNGAGGNAANGSVVSTPVFGGGIAIALAASTSGAYVGGSGSINGVGASGGTGASGNSYDRSVGGGGAGYGAGGGGVAYRLSDGAYAGGGASGQIIRAQLTLASLATIAVTIGTGGTGGSNSGGTGGAGASGCVVVCW